MKLVDNFHNDRSKKDGKHTICKQCKSTRYKGDFNTKICVDCKHILLLDQFDKSKRSKSGLRTVCIECMKKRIEKKINNILQNGKQCTNCKIVLSIDKFYKDKGRLSGLCGICKQCAILRSEMYIKNNIKLVKKRRKLEYRNNIEKHRQCSKKYYSKNKKHADNRVKLWCKNNKEKRATIRKKYNDSANGIITNIMCSLKAHDKRKKLLTDINKNDILELKKKQNNKCVYTGIELQWNNNNRKFRVSIDRIDSTKGHIKGNCQLVILPINYLKSNMSEAEFKLVLEIIKNPEEYNKGCPKSIISNMVMNDKICNMRNTCKKRNIKMELNKNILKEFIIKNDNVCKLSGIKLTWETNVFNKGSIDRIYPNKGYTLDNIQLCWYPINRLKSDFLTNEDVYEILNVIKNK